VEVRDFRGWPGLDGVSRILPVLGDYQELPSPLPLGVDEELLGWLPMQEEGLQILDLNTFWRLTASATSAPSPVPAPTGLLLTR
jgi:hypothetical protein